MAVIQFHELKEMKTREVTGTSDHFKKGLQFKIFLKKKKTSVITKVKTTKK